jgi:hypothetical protein
MTEETYLDSPHALAAEMVRLSRLLDEGLAAMRRYATEYAEAEKVYRQGKATAWVSVRAASSREEKVLAEELKARVEDATAELREKRDIAVGMKQAALEAVRSRRGQLSALQTHANALREETALARTGPHQGP